MKGQAVVWKRHDTFFLPIGVQKNFYPFLCQRDGAHSAHFLTILKLTIVFSLRPFLFLSFFFLSSQFSFSLTLSLSLSLSPPPPPSLFLSLSLSLSLSPTATKEAAFVQALLSASVTHEAAGACSENLLGERCGPLLNLPAKASDKEMPPKPRPQTQQLDTKKHDNIIAGSSIAESFMKSTKHSSWDERRVLINEHNNRLGRTVSKT